MPQASILRAGREALALVGRDNPPAVRAAVSLVRKPITG
jgi:hypothetical protein